MSMLTRLRVWSVMTALLPIATLVACGESTTAPDPVQDPPPDPQLTTAYDLDVEVRYINVRGSCDEDILGNSTPGEFQYRIVVKGEGQSNALESKGYNTVTGENFQRNAGTDINFANRTYTWRGLSASATVEVELHGAEWDGVAKDSRMANRGGSVKVPFALGRNTRSITIGATGACQIRLYYDAEWLERVITS